MPRQGGLFSFSGNFEPQIAEPLDSRLKVKTMQALHDKETWVAKDGGLYVYRGMIVAVTNDPEEENNGVYYLNNADDVENADSWLKLSYDKTINIDIDVAENGGLKLKDNALSIDDDITFVFDCGGSTDLLD